AWFGFEIPEMDLRVSPLNPRKSVPPFVFAKALISAT
ncbi:unnamed protein product, partial [marine sediment metagenome]